MRKAVVVGGGVIGAVAALELSKLNFNTAIVEKRALEQIKSTAFSRTIALNHKSVQYLDSLGLWQACEPWSCPIEQVHISMSGQMTTSRLKAQTLGCPALGYVIALHKLEHVLYQALAREGIDMHERSELTGMHYNDSWQLTLNQQQNVKQLDADLCLGADGQDSEVRRQLGIGCHTQNYEQSAWVGVIDFKARDAIAYEHFTPCGAVALLPMLGQQATFVWTLNHLQANFYKELSDEQFLFELQKAFPKLKYKSSALKIRRLIPLSEVKAHQQVAEHAVLMGNAAHSLHPIAAQGMNLSLRDVKSLQEHLSTHHDLQKGLLAYESSRQQDQTHIINFTHYLSQHVASRRWPLKLKQCGLILFEMLNPLKNHIARLNLGAV